MDNRFTVFGVGLVSITISYGVFLIGWAIAFSLVAESNSITSWIPAFLGLPILFGIVLLKHLSRSSECHSASLLAKSTKISLPHVRKILQLLHKAGFLVAKKGGQGGYSLSMPVENMSILAIVEAIDGPVLLTSCVDHSPCHIEGACQLSDHWRSVNMQVKSLLGQINLATMFEPIPPAVHEQSVPLNQIKRLRYV